VADILLVEDKESLRVVLRKTLESRGYGVEEAGDTYDARKRIQAARFLAVLTDLRLPAGSGLDVLAAAREADPDVAVIVMTAFGSIEEAVRAMKDGATDFLTKPVDPEHLLLLLERAIDRRRFLTEYVLLKEEYQRRFGLPRLLGEDPGLKETLLAIQRAATTDATVLILGESGTGKELLARSLHQLSPRAKGPFVAINCAAIPEALLENELFGHEKGAFTGAGSRKMGKAEIAHRGTLFLDEVGDLPLPLQAKILRLVQERQFERVGGVQTLSVDLRVVAATNQDLQARVAEKAFREDLFFRLSVFPVTIPPLRRRRGDIILLAEDFLARLARELGRRPFRLSPGAKRALLDHSWPGNVRELQNSLERAAILCDSGEIQAEQLRLQSPAGAMPGLADVLDLTGPLSEVVKRASSLAESEAIDRALARAGDDRSQAARELGISVGTLNRRLKERAEAAPGETRRTE
jgi:DNA-binding NtrC family response regulator